MAPGLELEIIDSEDVDPVTLTLPIDRATLRWLAALSKGSDEAAAQHIAEILRDIREDDEAAHRHFH